MAKEMNINLIPKDKLVLANMGDHIKDQKFEDKPIGYFKDAWRRFCKNKASIVAALIIICIILFAIIVPFLNFSGTGTQAETRYMKKGPRNLFLSQFGIATGTVDSELRDTALIQYTAIGIGSSTDFDNIITIGEALNSGDALQPVKKVTDSYTVQQGKNEIAMTDAKVDSYLEVGFIYLDITQSEYAKIVEWQEENEIQVLYPLVNLNEMNMYYATSGNSDPNWWYRTDTKGRPVSDYKVDHLGKAKYTLIEYDDVNDVKLVDNYMRDEEGNLVYHTYSGGGDATTAMFRVRVLFYNYYRYTHNGMEPEFIFGTDAVGYDLAYRMAIGIRLSLILAVCIFIINFILGAMYGAVEGYYGGTVDLVLEFVSYVLSGVPFMVTASLFQIHLAA